MPNRQTASPAIAEAANSASVIANADLLELMRQAAAESRSLRITLDEGTSEVGRVALIDGRVMWAACRSQRRVISTFLTRIGGVTREQLQAAAASDHVKNGQKPLFAVLEENKLVERPVLRRCVCLHVRAALRGLVGRAGAQVTARPFSARADDSLLFRIEEVLPARERRAARPVTRQDGAARGGPSGEAADGPISLSSFASIATSSPADSAATPAPGDGATDSAAPQEVGLRRALGELTALEGVVAAVLVGRDGFIIDGICSQGAINTEAIGAVIAAGMGSAEVMGSRLAVGDMAQSMFEYDDGAILASVAGDAILAVVTVAQANLGMVRHQFRKRCAEIAKVL